MVGIVSILYQFTIFFKSGKIILMGKQSREKLARRFVHRSSESEGGSPGVFQSGLEKTCLFIITWGTYLVLFTPLIINTKFFFPFVAPKTIFFRMMVEIILAAYLFLVIAKRNYRPRINALTIAIVLFLGVFIYQLTMKRLGQIKLEIQLLLKQVTLLQLLFRFRK